MNRRAKISILGGIIAFAPFVVLGVRGVPAPSCIPLVKFERPEHEIFGVLDKYNCPHHGREAPPFVCDHNDRYNYCFPSPAGDCLHSTDASLDGRYVLHMYLRPQYDRVNVIFYQTISFCGREYAVEKIIYDKNTNMKPNYKAVFETLVLKPDAVELENIIKEQLARFQEENKLKK